MEKILGNIKFNNINADSVFTTGGKYSNPSNSRRGVFNTNLEYEDILPAINAVEIDWNGAEVGEGLNINTTSELLAWLKESIEAASQSGSGAALTPEQEETFNTANNLLGFIKDYALRTEDADKRYATKQDIDDKVGNLGNISNGQSAQLAIYAFESFGDAEATIKWGEGKVEVTEMRSDGAKVRVIENNIEGFIGNEYNVNTLDSTNPIQLYDLDGNALGMWVKVTLVREATTGYPAVAHTVKSYIDQKLTDLIGSAPDTLDTLEEIAAALNDNATMTQVAEAIASKVSNEQLRDILSGYYTKEQLTAVIENKADASKVYTKTQVDELIGNVDVSSQLANYATKEDLNTLKDEIDASNEVAAGAIVDLNDRVSSLEEGGSDGKSAYEIAVANGFEGTEAQWLASLKGADGQDGQDGAAGANGTNGKSAYELYRETVVEREAQPAIYAFESFNNATKETKYGEGTAKVIEIRAGGATIEVVTNSTDQSFVGQQFNIATALATNDPIQLYTLENEPVDIWVTVELVSEAKEAVVAMTQSEWLASLKGADGQDGKDGAAGANGTDGADGKSAYELAVENGFAGTQSEWLASLKGDTGTFDASALEDYATKTFVGEKIGNLGNATEATEAQGVEGEPGYVPAQPAVAHTVKSYVDKKITDLVGTAPQELDTLKEIADKLGDNESVVGALTTQIASKANATDVYTKTEVDNKIGVLGNASDEVAAQDAVYEAVSAGSTLDANTTYYTLSDNEYTEYTIIGNEGEVAADTYYTKVSDAVAHQDAVPHTVKSYVDAKDATHYTKTAADEKFATIANLEEVERVTATALNNLNDDKANTADVYTKTEIDTKDAAHYTKTEVDNKIGDLGNATEATESQPAVAHTVKSYIDQKLTDLIGSAPDTLDTLEEIAAVLNDNATMTQVAEAIASKANAADVYTKAEVDAKDATHYTKVEVDNKIGALGNKSEAQDAVYSAVENGTTLTTGETYYTSNAGAGEFTAQGNEVADGTNYFVLTTAAVEAVPYENVMEVIIDNAEVTATAFADLQAKYEALLTRVEALENPGA